MEQTEQQQMSSHIMLSVSNKWSVHVMNIDGKMHATFTKRWTFPFINFNGRRQTAENETQEKKIRKSNEIWMNSTRNESMLK